VKKNILFIVAILFFSCQQKVKEEDLTKLNGYWEIKEVTKANGEKKDFNVNETIDYLEVKNKIGFRKKVMPQFDGKFKINDTKEYLKIIDSNNVYFIEYATEYGKWKEQIILIEDSLFIVKNIENIAYSYKRFKPFSFK
jgi:hypothetical protein